MTLEELKQKEKRLQSKVRKCKCMDRVLLYIQESCQLIVGIAGGISSILTFHRLFTAVYITNNIVPSLIFVSFMVGKFRKNNRVRMERLNTERIENLEACRDLETLQTPNPNEREKIDVYYNSLVSIINIDKVYLRPCQVKKDFHGTAIVENLSDGQPPMNSRTPPV